MQRLLLSLYLADLEAYKSTGLYGRQAAHKNDRVLAPEQDSRVKDVLRKLECFTDYLAAGRTNDDKAVELLLASQGNEHSCPLSSFEAKSDQGQEAGLR